MDRDRRRMKRWVEYGRTTRGKEEVLVELEKRVDIVVACGGGLSCPGRSSRRLQL